MFCPNCGAQVEDGLKFCPECGAQLNDAANVPPTQTASDSSQQSYQQSSESNRQSYDQQSYDQSYSNTSVTGLAERNIVLCIVLSIVTCGIYGIYWMIKLNDEINMLDGTPEDTSGIMVFLFTLITCGIYSFFWMYKMGNKVDNIKAGSGTVQGSLQSSVLFLILNFIGLGIINYCLMQDTINKALV